MRETENVGRTVGELRIRKSIAVLMKLVYDTFLSWRVCEEE